MLLVETIENLSVKDFDIKSKIEKAVKKDISETEEVRASLVLFTICRESS